MSDQPTNTADQPVEVGGHLQMIRRQTTRGLMEAFLIVGLLVSVIFVFQNFGSWTERVGTPSTAVASGSSGGSGTDKYLLSCPFVPTRASLIAAIESEIPQLIGTTGPAIINGGLSKASSCWGVGAVAPADMSSNPPVDEQWQGYEIIMHFTNHAWKFVTMGTALGWGYCGTNDQTPPSSRYYVPKAVICGPLPPQIEVRWSPTSPTTSTYPPKSTTTTAPPISLAVIALKNKFAPLLSTLVDAVNQGAPWAELSADLFAFGDFCAVQQDGCPGIQDSSSGEALLSAYGQVEFTIFACSLQEDCPSGTRSTLRNSEVPNLEAKFNSFHGREGAR